MDHEKEKIRRKIKSIKNLPTLPEVARKISKMVENDKTSATELAKIISTNAVISGRVLRLVNSSFYGFSGKISSISNAIILLGFDVVKSLIICVSVFEMMEKGIPGLWEHSLGCTIASRLIAKKVKGCDPEEVSVAGLLHDIGKIVVSIQLAEDYEEIKKTIVEKKINFSKAEKEVLELTHEDLGGWLAESWNLPVGLREPISFHHHPQQAQQAKLVTAIVHLADFLVRAVGYGFGGDPWVPALNHKAWDRLGLSLHDLEEIISDFCDELESLESEELL
jgi:putative nucleotidyltransferase with HDIG domain